jgi:hypothetical protein
MTIKLGEWFIYFKYMDDLDRRVKLGSDTIYVIDNRINVTFYLTICSPKKFKWLDKSNYYWNSYYECLLCGFGIIRFGYHKSILNSAKIKMLASGGRHNVRL